MKLRYAFFFIDRDANQSCPNSSASKIDLMVSLNFRSMVFDCTSFHLGSTNISVQFGWNIDRAAVIVFLSFNSI